MKSIIDMKRYKQKLLNLIHLFSTKLSQGDVKFALEISFTIYSSGFHKIFPTDFGKVNIFWRVTMSSIHPCKFKRKQIVNKKIKKIKNQVLSIVEHTAAPKLYLYNIVLQELFFNIKILLNCF